MNQNLTRSQRRMEKRQAIILLCTILAVALLSFSLGVMVGRSGSRPAAPEEQIAVFTGPKNTPAPPAARPAAPLAAPAQVEAPATPSGPPAQTTQPAPAATVPTDEKLTFYDTLPRGDQPLGSGINLPPQTPAGSATEAPNTPAASAASGKTPAPRSVTPNVLPPEAPPRLPAATSQGGYVVQLASFKDTAGATKFRETLAGKGYPLFTESANLGSKGVWYRVYAGPYADRDQAQQVAKQLQQSEHLSPLVRKR
jgi:DedD protein